MKHIIYLDSLIFLNTLVAYLILISVRALVNVKTTTVRMIVAAFFGGASSLVILLPRLPPVVSFMINTVICAGISTIAFYSGRPEQWVFCCFLQFVISFLYCGVLFFLSEAFGNIFIYQNGVGYFNVSFLSVVIASCLSYLLLKILKRNIKNKRKRFVYQIEVSHQGRSVRGRALFDSGHSVTDSYTGMPVVIAGEKIIRQLLDEDAYNELVNFGAPTDESLPEHIKARFIPVRTITGNHLLPAFTCGKMKVENDGVTGTVNGISLAFADQLTNLSDCDALINQNLIDMLKQVGEER